MRNDGLVVAQTHIQVVADSHQYQHQHTQPEQEAPVAPLEGVVLHVLGTEELIHTRGINLNANDFQRKALAFIRLAIDLHHKGWQVVERIVERGQRVDHLTVYETAVLALGAQFGTLQHLDAGNKLLRGLEDGELHLRAFLHRSRHGDVYLLADEHLDRVDGSLNGDLRTRDQRAYRQYYEQ